MSATCPECGLKPVGLGSISETLVGFISPPGHTHNDNCRNRLAWCAKGHRWGVSVIRTCPVCDWQGQKACQVCGGREKLSTWPDVEDEEGVPDVE